MGIQFASQKSIVLGPKKVSLYINNGLIPVAESCKYLGMEMNSSGIIWKEEFETRLAKLISTANWLRRKGMNGNGWRLNSCIQIYKSFLRPLIEYGVCLGIPKNAIKKLEKAQREILRRMISCRRTTSVEAMYKLFNITPMECRVSELQAKFYYRLKNLNHNNIIAYEMFNHCITKKHKDCLVSRVKTNELFSFFINNDKKEFGRKIQLIREKAIIITDINCEQNIAAAIEYDKHCRKGYMLNPEVNREDQRLLLLWRLGTFTYHQSCAKCGLKVTREHALNCSGEQMRLQYCFIELYNEWINSNQYNTNLFINWLINYAVKLYKYKQFQENR